MFGINGIYHYDETSLPFGQGLLSKMNDAVTHRGPDGDGLFIQNNIGLAHCRLSIIDLNEGAQPIYNEDNSIVIVFNGEIYNYKELCNDLIKRGHTFRTHTDTECIVHLYEEKGIDCLQSLNGMFAFAIWDINKQSLFIAHDRLGEKPLFYTRNKGRFLFSSELKSILKDTSIERKVDIQALDDYLAYGYVPAPKTILLNDAVKLQLRSDVTVGAFLSGGIDFSLIVSLAAKQLEGKLKTFCVDFPEKEHNESGYARVVSNKYNTNHTELIVDSVDVRESLDIINHFDEPFGDPSVIPTYHICREASQHVKVCLSGDSGDELFCGYNRYNHEPMEKVLDLFPPSLRKSLFSRIADGLPDYFRAKGRLRRIAASNQMRWQAKVGPFDPEQRLRLLRPEFRDQIDNNARLLEHYFKNKDLDEIEKWMYADQSTILPDDILVKIDRCAMFNSLEVRVPFLDYRIVEFANTIPLSLKKKNGILKYLTKELLAKDLSRDFINRKKKGFGLPIKHSLRNQHRDFCRDLLTSSDSRCTNFINRNAVQKLLEHNALSKRDLSRRVWTLICLEQWCRHHQI